ncbi:MAG TPA: bifunctional DNA-formamidopyrimidine glycosylase/DNA-(apurinic or apyrimidinic site) lyase [Alphaproteobacteria bacterium]|nr:DNA-formamidopyrimidine glycosylase [Rhodospirillaceae bacterium]HRJ12580.1 bifunctional DNA-formamidopyrimidine glycosylase/DNA-(apurinic or apyrimidinic site) lyase [Alphaproteobacteria bacterium]
MPELPEVETTRRGLLKSLKGRRILSASLYTPRLRLPFPRDLKKILTGAVVQNIERRAKYMLWELSGGEILVVHLGMSGRFRHVAKRNYIREKHDHMVLHLDDENILAYHDPRRFGLIDWAIDNKGKPHAWLTGMGIEPLSDDLNAPWLFSELQKRKTNMKAALLDQKMIVGLGNIYVSEALFLAGILPTRIAHTLTLAECKKLVPAIQKTLLAAIDAGGSSLRDYRDVDGQVGFFQDRFKVYDRSGEKCRKCKDIIHHLVQNGRSSYYCTVCQK